MVYNINREIEKDLSSHALIGLDPTKLRHDPCLVVVSSLMKNLAIDAGVAEVLTCGVVLLQDGVGGQDHRSIAVSM
jgi:hypothetical protein